MTSIVKDKFLWWFITFFYKICFNLPEFNLKMTKIYFSDEKTFIEGGRVSLNVSILSTHHFINFHSTQVCSTTEDKKFKWIACFSVRFLFIYQISFDIKQEAALSFSHFLQPSVWLFLRFFNVDRFIISRWCFANDTILLNFRRLKAYSGFFQCCSTKSSISHLRCSAKLFT